MPWTDATVLVAAPKPAQEDLRVESGSETKILSLVM